MKKYKVKKGFHKLKEGDILEFRYTLGENSFYSIGETPSISFQPNDIILAESYIKECGEEWFEKIDEI